MAKRFHRILTVAFKHDFYRSGLTPDFKVNPTPQTVQKIAGYRMLFNLLEAGFELAQSEPPAHEIKDNGNVFRFEMQLINNNFLNFTEEIPANGYVHHFKPTEGGKLTSNVIRVLPKLFNYLVQIEDGRIKWAHLKLFDKQTLIEDRRIHIEEKGTVEQIDLRNYPGSDITVKIIKDDEILIQEDLICDDQLFRRKPYGLIDLDLTQNATPANYELEFKTRKISWKYYLIYKQDEPEYTYRIEDRGSSEVTNRYSNFNFSFVEKIINEPLNGEHAMLFESGELNDEKEFTPLEIPLYEENRKNISVVRYPFEPNRPAKPKTKTSDKKWKWDNDDDHDDDDDDDQKKSQGESLYHFIIKKIWWNKILKKHHVTRWNELYESVKLKKPGKVVLAHLPKPSTNQSIQEVYIYL